jgi:ParB-like chromosome segregation protein Spo0J
MGSGVRLFGRDGEVAVSGDVQMDPSPAPGTDVVAAVPPQVGTPLPGAVSITPLALPSPLTTCLSDIVVEDLNVPLAHLVPNPRHPRNNWGQMDDDLSALAEDLAAMRLFVPIACTPYEHGAAGPLSIVKGHRRFAAAGQADLDEVPIHLLAHEDGRPLNAYEQLTYWLITTHADKKPFEQHTIVGIVCWIRERAALRASGGEEREPTQREIARALHVSLGTANRAVRIAAEPEPIVAAVISHTLQFDAALKLVDEVPDVQIRIGIIQSVLRRNAELADQRRGPLTVRQILSLARANQAPHQVLRSPVGPFWSQNYPLQPTNGMLATVREVPYVVSTPPMQENTAERIESPVSRTLSRPPAQRPPGLEVLTLLDREPQPSDTALLVALTRDTVVCFDRVVTAGWPFPKTLRKRYRALATPQIENTLEILLAQESRAVSGATGATRRSGRRQASGAPRAPGEKV